MKHLLIAGSWSCGALWEKKGKDLRLLRVLIPVPFVWEAQMKSQVAESCLTQLLLLWSFREHIGR